MTDPDSGYCLGCGRPPETSPEIVVELVTPVANSRYSGNDPDNAA
jgi:hypothetical protein